MKYKFDRRVVGIYALSFLLLVLLPLFMIIMTQNRYAHIEEAEAYAVTAHFSRVVETTGKQSVRAIYFTDHDSLALDIQYSMLSHIKNIRPGTELKILVHPNNRICMAIYDGNRTILDFEHSMNEIDKNRKWLLVIFWVYLSVGVIALAIAAVSEISTLLN